MTTITVDEDGRPVELRGKACWRDRDRVCGPDCAAYTRLPQPSYSHCQLLNTKRRRVEALENIVTELRRKR